MSFPYPSSVSTASILDANANEFLPKVYGITKQEFILRLQRCFHIPDATKIQIMEAIRFMTWGEYISYLGCLRRPGSTVEDKARIGIFSMDLAFYFDIAVKELHLEEVTSDPTFSQDTDIDDADIHFSLDEDSEESDEYFGRIRSNGSRYINPNLSPIYSPTR